MASEMLEEYKHIWDKVDSLPKDAQDVFFSVDTAEKIHKAAKDEQILPRAYMLAEITGDVILGMLPITQFRQTIQEELEVDEEKARRIAQTIRDKIFGKIPDSLRKIHKLDQTS